jgi:hypothetical protein
MSVVLMILIAIPFMLGTPVLYMYFQKKYLETCERKRKNNVVND